MALFFDFFVDCLADISNILDKFSFNIYGIEVTLFEIFLGFIAMGLIIAVFWKGSRA